MAKASKKLVSRCSRPRHFLELGNKLHLCGDMSGAANAYRQHLKSYPSDKQAHYNLAVTLSKHQPSAALASFQNALRLDPLYPEALNNLGILLHKQGDLDAARKLYAKALISRPGYIEAEYNLATAESNSGDYQDAIFRFSRILERTPLNADAWNNLGNALLAIREPADALEAFQMAMRIRPNLPTAQWNSGVAHLTLGHFHEGWAGFEHRENQRFTDAPRWDGSSLSGRHLLVHAEQGFGDTVQFVRYVPTLETFGGRVTFECPHKLVDLFNGIAGVNSFVPRGSDLPHFDCQVPLLSLPFLFGTTLETIPHVVPYLHAHVALIEAWRQRLAVSPEKLNVGLVWAGNPVHRHDRYRSIDPKLFASVLGHPDRVSFYSLQYKPQSEAAASMHPIAFSGILDDLSFLDLAAIMSNLDLVISVDTVTAHLAGALGRPVWTLLPYAPDWRWMLDRSDSPWYPTMRLFRQPRLNDWPSVLAQVSDELRRVAVDHKPVADVSE